MVPGNQKASMFESSPLLTQRTTASGAGRGVEGQVEEPPRGWAAGREEGTEPACVRGGVRTLHTAAFNPRSIQFAEVLAPFSTQESRGPERLTVLGSGRARSGLALQPPPTPVLSPQGPCWPGNGEISVGLLPLAPGRACHCPVARRPPISLEHLLEKELSPWTSWSQVSSQPTVRRLSMFPLSLEVN